jgi:aminoglycoside phosphotransferase (APT) family kinase protein
MEQPGIDIAEKILPELLGEKLTEVAPLESGSTSLVWRIQSDRRTYVFRLVANPEEMTVIAVDIHLRRVLASAGCRVAAPVISSLDCPEHQPRTGWIIDEFIAGSHPKRGEIEPTVCADLGETLACLHAIEVSGLGRPSLTGSIVLTGGDLDPLAALMTRFENPLPQTDQNLFEHPACLAAPRIVDELRAKLSEIVARLGEGAGVVCHSDLHERQFICAEGKMRALIDFWGATIASPLWDFASLFYFHGIVVLQNVVEAYTSDGVKRRDLMQGAVLFSLGIALHHASRSRLSGKEHRLSVAVSHLECTLAQLKKT